MQKKDHSSPTDSEEGVTSPYVIYMLDQVMFLLQHK